MSGRPAQALAGPGVVAAVSSSAGHRFSKTPKDVVELVRGLGVAGDSHAGVTVQHLSRVARDPSQPNLRQVHLIHAELFDELSAGGHHVEPGALGENISTRGLDLLALPRGTVLGLGPQARIEVTGLRNPCAQIDAFEKGLLKAVLRRADDGSVVRLAGIMSVVLAGGTVRPGDAVTVTFPVEPWQPLEPV